MIAATGLVLVLTSALAVVTTYQAHTRPTADPEVPEAARASAEMDAEMAEMKKKMQKMTVIVCAGVPASVWWKTMCGVHHVCE